MPSEPKSKTKSYLGDGVYVDLDPPNEGIILTTEDGYSASNTIYLESSVVFALKQYLKRYYNL